MATWEPEWTLQPPPFEDGPRREQCLDLETFHAMRSEVQCRATNRRGTRCGKHAEPWQLVCRFHGAAHPKARQAAYRRQLLAYERWNEMKPDQRLLEIFPCWPPRWDMPKPLFQELRKKQRNKTRAARKAAEKQAAALQQAEDIKAAGITIGMPSQDEQGQPDQVASWMDTRGVWADSYRLRLQPRIYG